MDTAWVIVVLTVVLTCITGWYAYETRQLVKLTNIQIKEIRKPVLAFQLIPWRGMALKLRIQNVGKGPAFNIEGSIESDMGVNKKSVPWSYSMLDVGKYEEFGVPSDSGKSIFHFDEIRNQVLTITAKFSYENDAGERFKLYYSINVKQLTQDWFDSKMLISQDSPEHMLPRIAEAIEELNMRK